MSKILIFDTNIFLTGIDFNLIDGFIYTTPSIIKEIDVERYKDKNRNIMNRVQAAIESKKLIIRTPSEEYMDDVNTKAKTTGDLNALSRPDKELIALTLELINDSNQDIILYTNDYSMENVCVELGIDFSPLGKKGIKSKRIWEVYCPFCKEVHPVEDLNKICETCNSRLKRRQKQP